MKAIETVYNGYRFRSRLEAKWGVFFDALGVEYEYEKEGYDLEGVWYLPDFWLPKQECWFEIKGSIPTTEEYEKARLLCRHSKQWVHIAQGELKIPTYKQPENWVHNLYDIYQWTKVYGYNPSSQRDSIYPDLPLTAWSECFWCHKIEIVPDGLLRHMSCECIEKQKKDLQDYTPISWPEDGRAIEERRNDLVKWIDKLTGHDTDHLIAAYTAARQARFEHGEGR